jgi:UDP-N-acetylmuramoyl-L-alanyl-D-glutamate--2,6-diaminopimelate ligase
MQTIAALLEGVDSQAPLMIGDAGGVAPRDITEDSRRVTPGALFVARPGANADGRKYCVDAARLGAAAILTDRAGAPAIARDTRLPVVGVDDVPRAAAIVGERSFDQPSRALAVVGVTGTNGKTTIAHLVQGLLRACGVECGLIGTVVIDTCAGVRQASLTTPPAIEVSRALAAMRAAGAKACAMETSSHALEQGRVAALRFTAGVYTNLTGDHLDYHGTMEAYASAKRILFDRLDADAAAIVNTDDAWAERITGATRAKRLACGDGAACRVRVADADARSTRLILDGPWGSVDARVGLVGAHNAMNTLQALCAAWDTLERLGATPSVDALRVALAGLTPPPGRLEPVTHDGAPAPFAVLVDYAHTDNALENALGAARPIVAPGSDLVVVFGCGGDRDRTKRPRMGRIATELADRAIVTSDNPRTEDPRRIIEQVLEGVPPARRPICEVEADRAAAIDLAISTARPGDVVVIAGKGHEDYQLLPDGRGGIVRRDFDDRVEARKALARRAERVHQARGAGAA